MPKPTTSVLSITATVASKSPALPTLYLDTEGVRIGKEDCDQAAPKIAWADLDEFEEMICLAQNFKAKMGVLASGDNTRR
jgi:hypothetical protein